MKQVVNVKILNCNLTNQFNCLPEQYEYDNKVFNIFRLEDSDVNAQFNIVDSKLSFNHDLMISSRLNYLHYTRRIPELKLTYIDRYKKGLQSYLLDTISGDYKNYKSLRTSSIDYKQHIPVININFSGDYVVKPDGGARSVGVMYVKAGTNIRSFLDKLYKKVKNVDNPTNEVVYDLCNAYGININKGTQNYENELANIIKSQALIIQEANTNTDVREIRVLISHAKPMLFLRTHMETNSPSVFDIEITMDNYSDYMSEETYVEINHMFSSGKLINFGSADVWISKQADEWGVYEFQNQYGFIYIPEERHMNFMKEFINNEYLVFNK